jgi:hypothetical protein
LPWLQYTTQCSSHPTCKQIDLVLQAVKQSQHSTYTRDTSGWKQWPRWTAYSDTLKLHLW